MPPLQPRLLSLQGRRPRHRRTRAREQARSGGEAPRKSRGKVARLLPRSSGEPISASARRDLRRARSRQATGDPASSALRRALRQAAMPHPRRPRDIRTRWMPGALGHRERTGSWLSLRSHSSSCTRSTMSGTKSVAEIFLACCRSTRVSRWPSSSRSSGSTSTRINDPTTLECVPMLLPIWRRSPTTSAGASAAACPKRGCWRPGARSKASSKSCGECWIIGATTSGGPGCAPRRRPRPRPKPRGPPPPRLLSEQLPEPPCSRDHRS
mmetsp:Transcript_68232/g.173282  ORF Transcript_68232/g.173282 Transcript_68232/m.173282 type:complete len:268 (+) Transcript_68232:3-806(+)